jgi:hypothetical protein
VRRQVLALDAARYGDRGLAARLAAVEVKGEADAAWNVVWATGSQVEPRLRNALTVHDEVIEAAATGAVEGRPVAVTAVASPAIPTWAPSVGRASMLNRSAR